VPSNDAEPRTFLSELRRVVDAVLCVGVACIVAALLGLDPFSDPVYFVIAAASGGLAYGLLLVSFDRAKRRLGASEKQ
jgi:hypothetical protein